MAVCQQGYKWFVFGRLYIKLILFGVFALAFLTHPYNPLNRRKTIPYPQCDQRDSVLESAPPQSPPLLFGTKTRTNSLELHPYGNIIRILTWTPHDRMPAGSQIYASCELPDNKTCENIVNKEELNSTEAVFFKAGYSLRIPFPQYRFPHQKWIFYETEAPSHDVFAKRFDISGDIFNLTSTYTLDSHIPVLKYHRVCSLNEKRLDRNRKINYAAKKQRHVAWFVSHCVTHSKRERYARALAQYIPVDIYGKCGNLSCGYRGNRTYCDNGLLSNDYKFYLSFENSLCKDYVTEKLYRLVLEHIPTLPIVMGGINYKAYLPAGTFLDVRDFKSPKHLAEYLWRLDKNDTLFNEYIARKNALDCRYLRSTEPGFHPWHACQMCKYLHDHRDEVTIVRNIWQFWSEEKRCTRPRDFFPSVFDSLVV